MPTKKQAAVAAGVVVALGLGTYALVRLRGRTRAPVIEAGTTKEDLVDDAAADDAETRTCEIGTDPWALDPPKTPRTALPQTVEVTSTTTVKSSSSRSNGFTVVVTGGLADGLQYGDLLVAERADGPVVLSLFEVEATATGIIRSKRGNLPAGTPLRFRKQQCSHVEDPAASAIVDGGAGWIELPTDELFAFPDNTANTTSVLLSPMRDVMPGNPAVVVFEDGTRSLGKLEKWFLDDAFLAFDGTFADYQLRAGRLFVVRSSCALVGTPTTIDLPLAKSVVSKARTLGPDKTEITFKGAARPDETAQLVLGEKIVPFAIDTVSATENTGTVSLPEASVKGATVEYEIWECDQPSYWSDAIKRQKAEVRHVWRDGVDLEVYAHALEPVLVGATATFSLSNGSVVKGTVHRLLREHDFLVTLPNANDLASRFCPKLVQDMQIDSMRCWLP